MENNEVKVEIKPSSQGIIQKSHPKAYFVSCNPRSSYFDKIVENNPRVLQIMVASNERIVVEMLPDNVYSEWIKEDNQ